jgi:hypothetical protein
MALKHRIAKLERAAGGRSRLHFLGVHVPEGQSKEVALERALVEAGLRLEQVGLLNFIGPHTYESEDRGRYAKYDDLIGYREFWEAVMAACAASPTNSIRSIIERRRGARSLGIKQEV